MKTHGCLSFIAAVALLILPAAGRCSSEVVAHVLTVGTYGNGNVYVALDQSIDEPGCSIPYIELAPTGPATKSVLATAALAVATSATIKVKTDTCFNGSPSFSGARQAWFVINKQ